MPPDVSLVIVNYKVKPLVMRLLLSIRAHVRIPHEIFVVDNASGDGIAADLARDFPDVRVIANADNRGFAAANNQAARAAKGRHVLLLNPDTELIEDCVTPLVQFADAHPQTGVVGCRVLNPDRTLQHSVLAFPTLGSQVPIMLKLHHLFPHLPAVRRYLRRDFDYERTQQVDQVIGACFLMTRAALDTIGLLDERYFIWFEEVDYCRMAKNAGLEVWYTPQTQIVHHGGQSFAQVFAPRRQRYFDASLVKYMRKHHGAGASMVVRVLHPLALFLAWIIGLLGIKRSTYA
ncbi:glycosyltransferase family 2 protein [Patescibacteria group bacterium]|nr:MAG: glycosyltransferase family 2 protein [Patescibacteria group bacterium]